MLILSVMGPSSVMKVSMTENFGDAVDLVLGRVPGGDLQDAAGAAAVADREVAGVEVDLLEQVGVVDAGEATEVVDQRNGDAIDERLAVLRRRATNDEQTDSERRPCDAGKELDRPKRVTARTRDAGQLFFVDRALHDLAWRRIDDGGFAKAPVRGPLLRAEPVDHLGDLPGSELLFGFEVAVLAAHNGDLVLPGFEIGRDEGPVRSGNQISDELASLVGNLDADRARSAVVFGEQNGARKPAGRDLLGRRLELEDVSVANARGDGLPVGACRLEDELAGGCNGGFIEGLSGRERHVHLGDPPIFAHDDVELDGRLLGLFAFDFGVSGLDEANELRRRDQRLLLGLGSGFRLTLALRTARKDPNDQERADQAKHGCSIRRASTSHKRKGRGLSWTTRAVLVKARLVLLRAMISGLPQLKCPDCVLAQPGLGGGWVLVIERSWRGCGGTVRR